MSPDMPDDADCEVPPPCWRWPTCDPVIGEDSCTWPSCDDRGGGSA